MTLARVISMKRKTRLTATEKELDSFMNSIINSITKSFLFGFNSHSATLKTLNDYNEEFKIKQSSKFSDDLIYTKLWGDSNRGILARFDKAQQLKFYTEVSGATGRSVETLIENENLKTKQKDFITGQIMFIRSIIDKTLQDYSISAYTAISEGFTVKEATKRIYQAKNINSNQARFRARNIASTYQRMITDARMTKVGVKTAIWKTSKDQAVRDSHASLDGQEYEVLKGIYDKTTGNFIKPGTDYNCRCFSKPVFNFDE